MLWTIYSTTKRYGNGGGSSVAERSAENREVGCSIHLLHSMDTKLWLICLCFMVIRVRRPLIQLTKFILRLAVRGVVGVVRREYRPVRALRSVLGRLSQKVSKIKSGVDEYIIDRVRYYLPPMLILWGKIRPALPNKPTYLFLRRTLISYFILYLVWGCSITTLLFGILTMFLTILLARAIMPRYRIDQLVNLNWKVLIFIVYIALLVFVTVS